MKHLIILLLCLAAANAKAFDAVAIDRTVSDFLGKWYGDECDDISYSFMHMIYVGDAYKRGAFDLDHPSDFKPPSLMTDVLVNFRVNACGLEKDYIVTLREDENGVKLVGYVSHDHPPQPD